MKLRGFHAVLLLGLLLGGPAGADSPIGNLTWARPIALGSAYVAADSDAASLFFSSANLAGIDHPSFISAYAKQGDDVTLTSLGGTFPGWLGGVVGLGYRNRAALGFPTSTETIDFYDHDLLLAFAKNIRPNLAIGGELRYLVRSASKELPSFKNGQGSAYGLSLKYSPADWLAFGAAIQDGGLKINYSGSSPDEYPANLVAGTSVHLRPELTINIDGSKERDDPIQWHFGGEWRPIKSAALRVGLDHKNYSAGFGLIYSGIKFDYAIYRNGALEELSHYFSLGFEPLPPEAPVSLEAVKLEPKTFPDVPEDYWAREAIEYLATNGLINWYPDGTFRPEQPISRAELMILLVRDKGYSIADKQLQVFSDVPVDFWAAPAIQAAYENKLTLGYPDKTFRPRNNTTRVEGAVFMARYDGLELKAGRSPYEDISNNYWALREVLAAKNAGLFDLLKIGDSFQPQASLTRAELAELLYRSMMYN